MNGCIFGSAPPNTMGRSSLDPHADLIRSLHAAGGRPAEIAAELKIRRGHDCNPTTVSRWISSNGYAPCGGSGPRQKQGRPSLEEHQASFDFLARIPEEHQESDESLLPTFLKLFSTFFRNIDCTGSFAAKALQEIGIDVEPNLPRSHWILPTSRLRSLNDLELCLLAYLLTDIRKPPVEESYDVFAKWLLELIRIAKRLKASIAQGGFVWLEDLIAAEGACQ